MKKILILILLIAISTNAQNISGEIIYTISLNPITKIKTESSRFKQSEIEKIFKIYKDSKKVYAKLEFNKNISKYQLIEELSNDSEKGLNLTRVFSGKDEKYFYDSTNKKLLLQKHELIDDYIILKKLVNWHITQESKKIGDYTCFKAIVIDTLSKKEKIAWFTPQIPVKFGPNKYTDLPGLILELDDSKLKYTATKVVLNPKKKIKIKPPTKGKIITDKEFKKLQRELYPQFFRKINN